MTAVEEEVLLHEERPPASSEPRVRLALGITTILVVAAIVGVASSGRQVQAATHDVGVLGAFLSEAAVEPSAEKATDASAELKAAQAALENAKKKAEQAAEAKEKTLAAAEAQAAAAAKAKEEAARAKAAADLKDAEKKNEEAQKLKKQSDDLKGQSAGMKNKSEDVAKDAHGIQEQAGKEESDAKKDRAQADELRQKAAAMVQQAKELVANSTELDKDAATKKSLAQQKEKEAKQIAQTSVDLQGKAEQTEKNAVDTEQKGLEETGAGRMCIKLPGVKIKGEAPASYAPVVGEQTLDDEWKCTDWCQKHAKCKQSVFTAETKTCELFEQATSEPISFRDRWPWHNSSYCGGLDEKEDMLKMLHAVYDQKPWVSPPHNCSWAGENCMDTKCCADVCKASWDFTTCQYYTCFKRDQYFAGCKLGGPEEGWDGTKLGGHPNYEIAPVEEGKLVQGTRLYCFTVVMWNQPPAEGWMDSEAMLVNHWKEQGKGITQCDDWNLFDGIPGGSVHNIQSFINAWKKVKEDGRWKNNDWSIKVDGDAVFFPDHLKSKIQYVYRTPQGSAVYLRNTFYKFHFLGALEALTKEALELYYEMGWKCEAHLGQEGGEDYWLEQCLEGLGIDFQTDNALLHDKYAADLNCNDPNNVAHHFFKKIDGGDGWDACWDQANNAWNAAHAQ